MVLFDLTFTYVLISAQLHVYRVTYSSGAGGRGLARPYINPVAHYVYYYESFQHQTMEGLYKFFFFSMWHKLTVDKGPLLDEP